jgi:hypothetical protein
MAEGAFVCLGCGDISEAKLLLQEVSKLLEVYSRVMTIKLAQYDVALN